MLNVFASLARGERHPETRDYEQEAWEYDFLNGVRNPYATRFREGTTQVVLDADVSATFRDSRSVNEALRLLIKTAKSIQYLPKAS